MEDQYVGPIAAIVIGGIAGWLAEQFMRSEMGILMNIILGIVGAALASWYKATRARGCAWSSALHQHLCAVSVYGPPLYAHCRR